MVEKVITPGRNVVDFAKYQQGRKTGAAKMSARTCRKDVGRPCIMKHSDRCDLTARAVDPWVVEHGIYGAERYAGRADGLDRQVDASDRSIFVDIA